MNRKATGVYMYLLDPDELRKWMEHRDLSYGELGQAVGVSRQFIWQLVKGVRRTCKPKTARLIEKFLLPPVSERRPGDKPLFERRVSNKFGDDTETVGPQD